MLEGAVREGEVDGVDVREFFHDLPAGRVSTVMEGLHRLKPVGEGVVHSIFTVFTSVSLIK